jgi:membrane glycosyltransferase
MPSAVGGAELTVALGPVPLHRAAFWNGFLSGLVAPLWLTGIALSPAAALMAVSTCLPYLMLLNNSRRSGCMQDGLGQAGE